MVEYAPIVYVTAWDELAKCFGERLQQDELDLMDSVLQGVVIDTLGDVKQQRYNEVVKLRETGLSYAKIGHQLGICRERVRQIVKGNPKRKKPSPDSKTMLKINEVAQLLRVHINTVRRWSNSGLLKSYRIGSRGDRRFRRQDVESFLSRAMQKRS
uniref:Putative DNA binding, helix-turn-helix domain containing protein n=1 Tax=viral metagenome TaxID=1070528 RepID=A0A6M3MB27_9ZZZZ